MMQNGCLRRGTHRGCETHFVWEILRSAPLSESAVSLLIFKGTSTFKGLSEEMRGRRQAASLQTRQKGTRHKSHPASPKTSLRFENHAAGSVSFSLYWRKLTVGTRTCCQPIKWSSAMSLDRIARATDANAPRCMAINENANFNRRD